MTATRIKVSNQSVQHGNFTDCSFGYKLTSKYTAIMISFLLCVTLWLLAAFLFIYLFFFFFLLLLLLFFPCFVFISIVFSASCLAMRSPYWERESVYCTVCHGLFAMSLGIIGKDIFNVY